MKSFPHNLKRSFLVLVIFYLITSCTNIITQKSEKIIAIQPFSGFNKELSSNLSKKITEFYGMKVIVLPEISLPESTYYAPRSRYRADKLIRFLKEIKPDSADYIIGLASVDVSYTNGKIPDYGIFGLGYCPGKSCVVSTFRYRKGVSEQVFISRFYKICLHEIGHNLGLPHCPAPSCMMNDANGKISTIDKEKMELCDGCKSKLLIFKDGFFN